MTKPQPKKKKVLFICTHNSARSQIAAALLNHLFPNHYEAYSAGTHPTTVHPLTIQVLQEIGIHIPNPQTHSISDLQDISFDYVITVCDRARQTCPYFPNGKRHLHQSFPDPTAQPGTPHEQIQAFRKVRDQIYHWLQQTFRTQ